MCPKQSVCKINCETLEEIDCDVLKASYTMLQKLIWLLFHLTAWLWDTADVMYIAVLSLDLIDAAGGVKTDADLGAEHVRGGVVHKYRLDHHGQQIGLDEYHTPKAEGFFFSRRNMMVSLFLSNNSSSIILLLRQTFSSADGK